MIHATEEEEIKWIVAQREKWTEKVHRAEMSLNLPEHVHVTFSWACPSCGEWSHGYGSTDLAEQEFFEHNDERHG